MEFMLKVFLKEDILYNIALFQQAEQMKNMKISCVIPSQSLSTLE